MTTKVSKLADKLGGLFKANTQPIQRPYMVLRDSGKQHFLLWAPLCGLVYAIRIWAYDVAKIKERTEDGETIPEVDKDGNPVVFTHVLNERASEMVCGNSMEEIVNGQYRMVTTAGQYKDESGKFRKTGVGGMGFNSKAGRKTIYTLAIQNEFYEDKDEEFLTQIMNEDPAIASLYEDLSNVRWDEITKKGNDQTSGKDVSSHESALDVSLPS